MTTKKWWKLQILVAPKAKDNNATKPSSTNIANTRDSKPPSPKVHDNNATKPTSIQKQKPRNGGISKPHSSKVEDNTITKYSKVEDNNATTQ